MSQPIRAAWIEIAVPCVTVLLSLSQPIRAAWIEIGMSLDTGIWRNRRSPFGLRGLKSVQNTALCGVTLGRSPFGLRGLK